MSSRIVCNYQNTRTGAVCKKTFSKPENQRRHQREVHGGQRRATRYHAELLSEGETSASPSTSLPATSISPRDATVSPTDGTSSLGDATGASTRLEPDAGVIPSMLQPPETSTDELPGAAPLSPELGHIPVTPFAPARPALNPLYTDTALREALVLSRHSSSSDESRSGDRRETTSNLHSKPTGAVDATPSSTPTQKDAIGPPLRQLPLPLGLSKKRKWLSSSFNKDAAPGYLTKLSPHNSNQELAIDWLKDEAKQAFIHDYTAVLNRWGLSQDHNGSCVLCPSDWTTLSPLTAAQLLKPESCPPCDQESIRFKFADHHTTLARAAAWFSQRRRGIDLDNFISCGPFKRMHASHLCHQHACIVHIQYEPADLNMHRKGCHDEAKLIRQAQQPVPRNCEVHSPPCLLQQAALTTYEAYCIQVSILYAAKGLPLRHFERPPRHPYSTFETRLPIQFKHEQPSAIVAESGNLVSYTATASRHPDKPDLLCRFCVKIRNFESIIALWRHLVRHHDSVSQEERLEDIQRTARIWEQYWETAYGGKVENPTMQKLRELKQPSFEWKDVLAWGLDRSRVPLPRDDEADEPRP